MAILIKMLICVLVLVGQVQSFSINSIHRRNLEYLSYDGKLEMTQEQKSYITSLLWDHFYKEEYFQNNFTNIRLNRTHLLVEQTGNAYELPVIFWKWRDFIVPNMDEFFYGIRLYDFPGLTPFFPGLDNTSNCFFNMSNLTWAEIPLYIRYVRADNPGTWAKWNVTTTFLQRVAKALWTCNDNAKNFYVFTQDRRLMFDYSWLNFTYGFLQNVLAKIISINNIYRSLNRAVNYGDQPKQWYNIGRLVRNLIIFPPIELEEPEDDYYYNYDGRYYQYELYNEDGTLKADTTIVESRRPESLIDLVLSLDKLTQRWSKIFSYLKNDLVSMVIGHDHYPTGQMPRVQHNDTNEEIYTQEIGWLSVQQFFELLYGFSMGTGIMEGMSLDQCTGAFQRMFNDVGEINADYRAEFAKYAGFEFSDFDLWPYLIINDKIISVIYNIHDISEGCYYGGFEAYGALANYFAWYYNPSLLTQNIVFNFGFIYVNVRDLILLVQRDSRTPVKTMYQLGRHIGQIYFFLFIVPYYTETFFAYNPSEIDPTEGVTNSTAQVIQDAATLVNTTQAIVDTAIFQQ